MTRAGRRLVAALACSVVSCLTSTAAVAAESGGPAAQRPPSVDYLTGTLAKAYRTGKILLGYRASSIPFSYVGPRQEPIGYSVDICRNLVEQMSAVVGVPLAITWIPVTAESRFQAIGDGRIDIECGSTTATTEREKLVAFSPAVFISGVKLLVRKGSPIRGHENLAGKTVVYTIGTTGEAAVKSAMAREGVKVHLVAAADHEEGWRLLEQGKVDAFVNDDVLLYGAIAQHGARDRFEVVGDFLSYEPYGIAYRRNDAGMMRLVNSTVNDMAASHELEKLYGKWFQSDLPLGNRIDLPMSLQLRELLKIMGGEVR